MDASELRRLTDAWMGAMRRGDFAEAWRQTDRIESERRMREAAGTLREREPWHLTWNGAPFDGKRVLVGCTHGLGDTLQFARFIPPLSRIARHVTFCVQPQLQSIFAGAAEFGDVRNAWSQEMLPSHDVEIEIMELAYAFRSTVETLPNRVPYLPLHAIEACAPRLPAIRRSGALAVGLLWAVSDWDTTRSIPLDALEPLGRVADVRFHSLQQGRDAKAWQSAPLRMEPLSRHTQEIAAAGAAMRELDLVISADGMAAHLAGALGRPVWVLLQHDADWRWMEGRSSSPWYPTLQLYRQTRAGDWRAAIERAAADLAALAETALNSGERALSR
jgi:hypothetical protein